MDKVVLEGGAGYYKCGWESYGEVLCSSLVIVLALGKSECE